MLRNVIREMPTWLGADMRLCFEHGFAQVAIPLQLVPGN
jgi:hypothetical protein